MTNHLRYVRTGRAYFLSTNKHPFYWVGMARAPFHGTERLVSPDYWMPTANEEQVEGSDLMHSR